jgi:hypothetical protein
MNFVIWFQYQHLYKPCMPNHVVEVLENYDYKLLLTKIWDMHIDLFNEPLTTSSSRPCTWFSAHVSLKSSNIYMW